MRGCRVHAPNSSYIATFEVLTAASHVTGPVGRIVVLSSFWTTLKTKALPFVEMSAATGPLTWRHIPDVAMQRFML